MAKGACRSPGEPGGTAGGGSIRPKTPKFLKTSIRHPSFIKVQQSAHVLGRREELAKMNEPRYAFVTGSSGGIGRSIVSMLEDEGYIPVPISTRMEHFPQLRHEVENFAANHPVHALITCAGVGLFQPLESIGHEEIRHLIDVNLTAPILLTQSLLPHLKKTGGHILHVASIEATRHTAYSSAFTATKAGLREFSLTLFEEVRRMGIRVTVINPGMVRTNFYENLSFEPDDKPDTALSPQDVANLVKTALRSDGVVVDVTVRPQKMGIRHKKRD
ncbi:MAG: SDR family oxidoreductase [Spirochaetales bacterium]|nr:SDR family oxidoreductase [Spirochaetales bacterium]